MVKLPPRPDRKSTRTGTWRNTLCSTEIDPDVAEHTVPTGNWPETRRKSTQDVAEHTLPTGNGPGTWRNTLYRPENDQGRGGTHSTDRKLTRDMTEHTLPTEKRPGTWRNTLFRQIIDPGRGRTQSAKWNLLIVHDTLRELYKVKPHKAPRRSIAPPDFMHGIYKRFFL